MEVQAEEQATEAQKERKLRERNEQYSRQLEEELEGLKVSPTESVYVLASQNTKFSCSSFRSNCSPFLLPPS